MKKNEIFTFKDSKGVEVTGVVVAPITCTISFTQASPRDYFEDGIKLSPIIPVAYYICYAQNKLFCCCEHMGKNTNEVSFENIIVEYCVIPELDKYLDEYNDHLVSQAETLSGM